ncbi:MAG: hypothetical protein K0Q73_8925 [Paenibacillus sp.]|nr:hypothetical protein [Paenibacillus sp.]
MLYELGEYLKRLRGDLSLREAGKRSGVSYTYIGALEKGRHPRTGETIQPSPDTLKALAKAYKSDYEDLFKVAGIIPIDNETDSKSQKNEFILRELANKYNIDLSAPGVADKLDRIIQVVVDDFEGKKK